MTNSEKLEVAAEHLSDFLGQMETGDWLPLDIADIQQIRDYLATFWRDPETPAEYRHEDSTRALWSPNASREFTDWREQVWVAYIITKVRQYRDEDSSISEAHIELELRRPSHLWEYSVTVVVADSMPQRKFYLYRPSPNEDE